MAQKLLGAVGIVGVLIVGEILISSSGNSSAASTAIDAGVGLGIIFGGLGVIGIIKRLI